jgi:hypothetical protein
LFTDNLASSVLQDDNKCFQRREMGMTTAGYANVFNFASVKRTRDGYNKANANYNVNNNNNGNNNNNDNDNNTKNSVQFSSLVT